MPEVRFQKYKKSPGYHWDQMSRHYKERNIYVIGRYALVTQNLRKMDGVGKKALDIGCGDGIMVSKIGRMGFETHGIDTADEAVEFAKKRLASYSNIHLQVGSAYQLPHSDNSFDVVVATEIIEHLPEPEKMLSEIRRVWNEKGRVVITTPIKITDKPLDPEHVKEFYVDDLKSLLQQTFSDCQITMEESHPLVWKEIYEKPLFGYRFFRVFLNLFEMLTGVNPFLRGKKWRYFTQQVAVIEKS